MSEPINLNLKTDRNVNVYFNAGKIGRYITKKPSTSGNGIEISGFHKNLNYPNVRDLMLVMYL